MRPLVSIITPSYNSAKFIAKTIQSVKDQTFQDWELLIVDDCSTDATPEIVRDFLSDQRIVFHRLSINSGAGIARNTAVNMAKGRYIAFLDSDDLWLTQKLEKQLEFMKVKGLPFTFSFYDCIDENGKSVQKHVQAPRTLTYRQLFFCNFVGNLTGIYDTEYFGKIPISSIRKRQDWILWLEILKKIRSAQPVPQSLALYRIRTDSISASKWKLLRHNYIVYREYHRLNVFFSILAMAGFLFTQLLIKPRFAKNYDSFSASN